MQVHIDVFDILCSIRRPVVFFISEIRWLYYQSFYEENIMAFWYFAYPMLRVSLKEEM